MSLHNSYPDDPIELKRLELKTLQFLNTNQDIVQNFSNLFTDAGNHYHALKNQIEDKDFNFYSTLEYEVNNEDLQKRILFHIGGKIESSLIRKERRRKFYEYNEITYCLLLLDPSENPPKLLRKIHFDYADKSQANKPIFHLQIPGTLTPELKNLGYTNADILHMQPWLSLPRINYYPVTVALLLNLIFLEFTSETTHRIVENTTWRSIVRENEQAVLKRYHNCCQSFLNKADDKNLFMNEFCYDR